MAHANGNEAVSTALHANGKAVNAAKDHRETNTGLKPGANERTAQSPQGFGVRQPSAAFDDPRRSKRQRAAALQDAAAPATPDFLIWQLMDSAFPTGGFAHSSGLEAAWQHGEVRGRTELTAFIETSLDQVGHAGLPFVTAAFDAPEKLTEFDALCDAFTTNHVANRASRAQGRAFLTAVERIFPERGQPCPPVNEKSEELADKAVRAPFAHFAPVFGACLHKLDISRETTARMFFFNHLRSVLAAAVRLNIVGPMEAQILQHQLSPDAERIRQRCENLSLDQIAQTVPLMDLWQGAQDRLYSRLFQS
ncbi:MAG TPA: urease accessory UreF family protein [Verrucomicrobiota bacterium]|nr:urease accessory UreF family protein [Verrucomicrobiota bacterium]